MKKRITLLFTIMALAFVNVNGQYTTDGIYTIFCVGKSTYMSIGEPGKPMSMTSELTDDCKFYIVTNTTDATKYNIITLDSQYVASTTGAYGTLIENTAANRDSSVALVDLVDQGSNPYFIETYIDGGATLKRWNGQRGGGTQVGMGSTDSDNYRWELTRVDGEAEANAAPTDISLSATEIDENNVVNDTIGMFSVSDVDSADTHTYTLVAGDGTNDADNAAFTIADNVLTINESADFEAKASYNINVKVADNGGLEFTKAFVITINDITEGSSLNGITLSANSFDENIDAGSTVAILTAIDDDTEATHTFTLESGDGTNDADNSKFTISGDSLIIISSPDFETQSDYYLNLKVESNTSLTITAQVMLSVIDVNEAPTDVALSNDSIAENAEIGTVIGTLTATDVDANSTLTYTLSGTDSASFTINGDQLMNAEVFDFETKASYSITVTVSDSTLSVSSDFTISVLDEDESVVSTIDGMYTLFCVGKSTYMSIGEPGRPMSMTAELTDDNKFYIVANPADANKYNIITVDGRYVASTTGAYGALIENTAANRDSSVAAVDLVDQGASNPYFIETYVDGGVTLKRWNGQRGGGTQVGMGSTDSDNYKWELTRVGEVPESNIAPTDIFLSATVIDEDNAANDTIGMLSAFDGNPFDSHTYSLVAGDGTNDADNAEFTITGNVLTINAITDFETKASYNVNVKVADNGGLEFTKAIVITVNDIAEGSIDGVTLSATSLNENIDAGSTVAIITAINNDEGATHTFTLESGDGTNDADNSKFTITGDSLNIISSPDFEAQSVYNLNLKVESNTSLTAIVQVLLTVIDVNEAPSDIALSNDTIAENAAAGTTIGTLTATDVDANSTLTYTLSGTDAASFTIDGDQLMNAEVFDFETKASYDITVTVSDGTLTASNDFTISVNDKTETSIAKNELSKLSFYPNPVTNLLTIKGVESNAKVSIYSITGALIKVSDLTNGANKIDFSDLSVGVYILEVKNATNQVFRTKITK